MSVGLPSHAALDHHHLVPGRIYSVGYEGLDLPGLVNQLTASNVSLLVDVRLNAISRKRGFSRKALTAGLEQAGISYRHEPALGNPADNRDSFRQGDAEEGRRRLRELLGADSEPALKRLVDDARNSRVAVLCVERDRNRCHRQVITDLVQEMEPSIEVLQIL